VTSKLNVGKRILPLTKNQLTAPAACGAYFSTVAVVVNASLKLAMTVGVHLMT